MRWGENCDDVIPGAWPNGEECTINDMYEIALKCTFLLNFSAHCPTHYAYPSYNHFQGGEWNSFGMESRLVTTVTNISLKNSGLACVV